ncbi:MAG TPA: hypothetical protein PLO62_08215 [Candidatus Hydrogenedentes bacterium]|nr:hypothetical protein [Candidatus Hydrogenedentota bacterium]
MSRIHAIGIAVVLAAAGSAAHAAPSKDFFISFWFGLPNLAPQTVQRVAAANYTTAMISGSPEAIHAAMDLCGEYGLTALIVDPRITAAYGWTLLAEDPLKRVEAHDVPLAEVQSRIDAVVRDHAAHPALWGYLVTDEPCASQFARLREIHQALRRRDSGHVAFVNLHPAYAPPGVLECATYDAYVKRFVKMVRPDLLCYDHYAFLADGERADFFENMEIVRRHALKARIPFYFVLLTSQIEEPYRSPTEAEIRWQTYAALAYGATGLMHFHIPGILGSPERYAEIARINGEVKALGPTLMQLRSTGVFHAAASLPAGTQSFRKSGPLRAIEGGEFIVGYFRGPRATRYAMIVNRDFNRPATARALLAPGTTPERICEKTGQAEAIATEPVEKGVQMTLALEPGHGALLRFRERPKAAAAFVRANAP